MIRRRRKRKLPMKPDFQNDNAGEKILPSLPLAITNISPQKKNSDRFSLFHEKTFLIGVSSQTLLDYSIQKGTLLTRDLFHRLNNSEEYQAVKDRCYKLLSGRDHGAEELKRKLVQKGFSPAISDQVVAEFREKDLLNDRTYATKFAHDKHHLKQWGPRKIKSALFKKGVPKTVISDVIQELKNDIDPVDTCVELVLKRRRHFLREGDLFKRKQKIFRYLAGKGYSSDKIKKALPNIEQQLDA
jgi:regulatory protein